MSIVARDVIETARDQHPAFDRSRHSDALLLRHLSSEQRRLLGKLAQANPSAVSTLVSVTLASYDFDAGYDLPALQWLDPRGEVISENDDIAPRPFYLRNYADRHVTERGFFGAEHGGRLYLFGDATDWDGIASVRLTYVSTGGMLTSLTTPLTLPDSAHPFLVASLAVLMSKRGHMDPKLPPIDVRGAQGLADRCESDFMREVGATFRARTFRVRQVV